MNWYAVASPGLEAVVARELGTGEILAGGVRFSSDTAAALARVPMLRTPTRVLAELCEGPGRSLEEVDALVRRVAWKTWLHGGAEVEVHATLSRSKLRFRESLEKRVALRIRESLKGPRVVDRGRRPTMIQRVQVRVAEDVATISLDAGGELLHVRGWRTEQGPAPIRENLAAAMLFAAGWTGTEPLLDPFCGSGTIAIEGALLATGRSPFVGRRFAFEEWPCAPRLTKVRASGGATIFASDRDTRALAAAEGNARRAGVKVAFRQADLADLQPPAATGTIVTNPPYGNRMGSADAYPALGRLWRERFTGWRLLFLAPDPRTAAQVDRRARRVCTFSNGGVKVALMEV